MFKLLNSILTLFYNPPDTEIGGVPESKELSEQETFELLDTDEKTEEETLELEPKKESKKDDEDDETKEKDDDEEKEEDELKEIEEELEETPEEKLELMTPVRRKEILAKFPRLFKEFPYLESAYYREQEFTQLFPSIGDAKDAVKKVETLDKFEEDLLSGNTENVLKLVKQHDENTFNSIVDNYLSTLAKVDKDAHLHVVGNIIKDTIVTMIQEARASDNDALKNAAAILNQFVFGSSTFTPKQLLAKEDTRENPKEKELKEREQKILKESFDRSKTEINTKIDTVLKGTIEKYIDPKESMTDYVRRNAIREAMETTQSIISRDSRFRGLLDKLWERAFKENFSTESTERIRQAYLSRAKTVMPSVIKKARNEALKGLGKRVKEDEEEVEIETPKKGPVPPGRSTTPDNRGFKGTTDKEKATKIPSGMSALDYLMQD